MVFSAATNCSNSFKSSISMFDFPKEENFEIHFTRQNIHAFVRSTNHFTKDSFKQNLSARSLLVSAFKPWRLDLRKDAVPTIFNFKIGIGQKRSHGNSHPCPPKSGTTLQGNSESVHSALPKRRKLKIRICHLVIN